MHLVDLLRFNPLHLFLPAKVTPKSNYRVTIKIEALKDIIHDQIIIKDEDLETLEVKTQDGQIHLQGVYSMNWLRVKPILGLPTRLFGIHSINYRIRLKPQRAKNNFIICQVIGYRVWDTSERKLDLVWWFGKLDPFHKKKVFNSIIRSFPSILSVSGFQWEVSINMNHFLRMVPDLAKTMSGSVAAPVAGSLAGSVVDTVDIQNVSVGKGEIFLYTKSSSMLKPLMDFFGPEFLDVDFVDDHVDEQRLLTDIR